ncbi:hypothetical protein [Microbacterium gubbeenense]|uniref:hypothetical protein n=1 Tax=Microbacterium gubbeenense TaxID=159896 RepID=UPI00040CB314|nr:hypothetical protein [Microbacterium gubbeenense]
MNRNRLAASAAIFAGLILTLAGCATPSEQSAGAETAGSEVPTATPTAEVETLSEEQSAEARGLCEEEADRMNPAGAIVHWSEDDSAPHRSEGGWVLTANATLTDQSGAEHSDAKIECYLAATDAGFVVDEFMGSY